MSDADRRSAVRYEILKRPSNAVLDVTLDDGERIGANPGAMISRSATVDTDTEVAGGEGYVTRFTGTGTVWLRTRDPLVFMQSAGRN